MKTINQRTLIRRKISSLIIEGKTLAQDRVEQNSTDPDWDDDDSLPAVRIYYEAEPINKLTDSPREWLRPLQIVIELICATKRDRETNRETEAQDQIDELDQQIKNLLLVDETLGGEADDLEPLANTFDFGSTGKREVVTMRSVYKVTYLDLAVESINDQKQLGLQDFKTVKTSWNINTDNDNDDPSGKILTEAEDETSLPQT